MAERSLYQCQCPICISHEEHPGKVIHYQMNVFRSRLNGGGRPSVEKTTRNKVGIGDGGEGRNGRRSESDLILHHHNAHKSGKLFLYDS